MRRHEPAQLELVPRPAHVLLELDAGDVVVERFELSGGNGFTDAELADWLDQWRGRDDVRVLVAADESHLLVVRTG